LRKGARGGGENSIQMSKHAVASRCTITHKCVNAHKVKLHPGVKYPVVGHDVSHQPVCVLAHRLAVE
jgi:hypothetical protein